MTSSRPSHAVVLRGQSGSGSAGFDRPFEDVLVFELDPEDGGAPGDDDVTDAELEPRPTCIASAAFIVKHLRGAWGDKGQLARRSGKVLVVGSASALRGMKRASTYSAARGAQLAYVQAVGVELAPHQVQVNAIAQNFVDNPTYFPPEVQANPRFQERLAREVPLGRLGKPEEIADAFAFLASDEASYINGIVLEVGGGVTL